jgi:hypothetical protein
VELASGAEKSELLKHAQRLTERLQTVAAASRTERSGPGTMIRRQTS